MATKEITINYEMFTGANPGIIIDLLGTSAPDYKVIEDDANRTFIIGRGNEMEIIEGDYIVAYPSGYVDTYRSEVFMQMFG